MKGYFKDKEATEKSMDGGWFHSGDLAVTHPSGYIKIQDRSKDIIISGGENISSIEIENTISKHPAVSLAAVVAKPDEKWGETPCAFVELIEGKSSSEEEIIKKSELKKQINSLSKDYNLPSELICTSKNLVKFIRGDSSVSINRGWRAKIFKI